MVYGKDHFSETSGGHTYYSVNTLGKTGYISVENKTGVLLHTEDKFQMIKDISVLN